jgi:hypothetical protein
LSFAYAQGKAPAETTEKRDTPVSNVKTEASRTARPSISHILFPQRKVGNLAVRRLLESGHIQAKLKISQPNDVYEQEADEIAKQAIHTTGLKTFENAKISSALGTTPEGNDVLESNVSAFLRGGQPLPKSVRTSFEQLFGHDFSQVRVHSDAAAEQSARDLNANAYTVGHNIVFGAGSFAPGTGEGRRLIAHELAHVVQQSSASPGGALQRQPDPKKEEKAKPQTNVPPQAVPPPKVGLPDFAVLLSPDKDFVTLATVIAPGAKILHATSVDDLARQLKAIKGPIGTLYFVVHMLDDGALMFETPGTTGIMDFVLAETIATKIKGSVQVESLDFRGCQFAQAPAEMDKIRLALTATKITGGTCSLVTQTANPIKTVGGKEITKPEQLKDQKVKADFVAGRKKVRELFLDNKKKCIINDSVDGYFQTGGKLIAVWANPGSMADETGWDDTKSICYDKLKTEKIDPTKKLPVIDPDDCKLIEVGKKQP